MLNFSIFYLKINRMGCFLFCGQKNQGPFIHLPTAVDLSMGQGRKPQHQACYGWHTGMVSLVEYGTVLIRFFLEVFPCRGETFS
jgi:hypothetical protein